jgi:hypothetical protein
MGVLLFYGFLLIGFFAPLIALPKYLSLFLGVFKDTEKKIGVENHPYFLFDYTSYKASSGHSVAPQQS